MRIAALLWTAAVVLTLSATVKAQAPAAPQTSPMEELGTPAQRAKARRASGKTLSVGVDQSALESYLKDRIAKIKQFHKSQRDFMSKQDSDWENFWDQVRDDRNLFETRIARQRLDLFESLASLHPKDRTSSVNDFERLQSNVMRAFDADLKQKIAKFFAERETQYRAYAVTEDKERVEFAATGEASWQTQKALIMKAVEAAKK